LLIITTLLSVGLAAFTLGYWAFVGEMSGLVAAVAGMIGMSGFAASFVTLLIGLIVLYVLGLVAAALIMRSGRRVVPAE